MNAKSEFELTDREWSAIRPVLPNRSRGIPRVDDRRVLSGIFWVLRSGAAWRSLPKDYGPYSTCYNRFVRWRKSGIWDRILAAVSEGGEVEVALIGRARARNVGRSEAAGKAGPTGHQSHRAP